MSTECRNSLINEARPFMRKTSLTVLAARMKRNSRFLFSLSMLLCFAEFSNAQPWSGILSPVRGTDWSQAGVVGGIPDRTTRSGSVIAAYSGSAATINTALANCGANQYVELGSGTFTLSSGIIFSKSNCTLRGQGAGSTKLMINGSNSGCGIGFIKFAIRVCTDQGNLSGSGGSPAPRHTATWSAGYAKGTTVLTLSSTTGLEVGGTIILDQANDAVTNGVTDGYPGPGDILQCEGTQPCSGDGGNSWARSGRFHSELHLVQAVNGNNVTISPAIHSPDFRSSQSPGAWWGNRSGSPIDIIENVGLENFSVDWTGAGDNVSCIAFINATNFWQKGLRVVRMGNTGSFIMHDYIINGLNGTLRDNYFYGPESSGGSNNTNYAYASHMTSSMLVANNIYHNNPSPILPNDPDAGSVFAYNLTSSAWYSTRGSQQHNGADMYQLYEGNNFGQVYNDNNHGTHHFLTYFRNHIDGDSRNPTGGVSTTAGFALLTHNRFYNLIGNVIGGSPFTTYGTTNAQGSNAIYSLDWRGNCSNCGSMPNDSNVTRTLMRWGNWDSVNNSTRFLASEVPSGITNYANPVPASQTLPASFFLSAQPSWWTTPFGTPKWPPIGPDVTGGNVSTSATGGHADKIPARLCLDNAADDPAYGGSVRSFNAASCYAQGGGPPPPPPPPPPTPPNAPTSLSLVVR